MTRPTVAVVVCAYTEDRWADMCASLRSAAAQVPVPDELLLVVDHNDDLLERAQRELGAELPAVVVIGNRRKKGLSGARNTALLEVSSDVVAFLDDDASADAGWLAALLDAYTAGTVMAVGGAAIPVWPPGQGRPVTLPKSTRATRGELDWVVGCTYLGQPAETAPVRNLMGCNMSFQRNVFVAVGGFSENLGRVGRTPLGCEETELCIRAARAFPEALMLFVPHALVRHQVSADRLTWRYLRSRCYAEGLSKAAVALMQGQRRALDTERRYASRVLPVAVARELGGVVSPRGGTRGSHVLGAGALLIGLTWTTLGYVRGSAALRSRKARESAPDDLGRELAVT